MPYMALQCQNALCTFFWSTLNFLLLLHIFRRTLHCRVTHVSQKQMLLYCYFVLLQDAILALSISFFETNTCTFTLKVNLNFELLQTCRNRFLCLLIIFLVFFSTVNMKYDVLLYSFFSWCKTIFQDSNICLFMVMWSAESLVIILLLTVPYFSLYIYIV